MVQLDLAAERTATLWGCALAIEAIALWRNETIESWSATTVLEDLSPICTTDEILLRKYLSATKLPDRSLKCLLEAIFQQLYVQNEEHQFDGKQMCKWIGKADVNLKLWYNGISVQKPRINDFGCLPQLHANARKLQTQLQIKLQVKLDLLSKAGTSVALLKLKELDEQLLQVGQFWQQEQRMRELELDCLHKRFVALGFRLERELCYMNGQGKQSLEATAVLFVLHRTYHLRLETEILRLAVGLTQKLRQQVNLQKLATAQLDTVLHEMQNYFEKRLPAPVPSAVKCYLYSRLNPVQLWHQLNEDLVQVTWLGTDSNCALALCDRLLANLSPLCQEAYAIYSQDLARQNSNFSLN